MRRTLLLFVSSLLMWSFSAGLVAQSSSNAQDSLSAGLQSIREGNKTEAWHKLFPLAQQGNNAAMFFLGEMMVRSPEYPDHLERAKQFLNTAASRGHKGAAALLQQVDEIIKRQAQALAPTIAGASGIPTDGDRAALQAAYEKYKNEVLRYTNVSHDMASGVKHELNVFLSQRDAGASTLYDELNKIMTDSKDVIKSNVFLVLDASSWNPDEKIFNALPFTVGGVLPDWGGKIAAAHGAKSTPAYSISHPSGERTTSYDLNQIRHKIQEISQLESSK